MSSFDPQEEGPFSNDDHTRSGSEPGDSEHSPPPNEGRSARDGQPVRKDDGHLPSTDSPEDNASGSPGLAGTSEREQGTEPSRTDLLAYLLENRAAIDVLFEMLAFNRADGEEEAYRHFLDAMRDRHEQAAQRYREALDWDLPELDLDPVSPPSEEDPPHSEAPR